MRHVKFLTILFSIILPFSSPLQADLEPSLKDTQILESAYVGDAGSLSENLKQLRDIFQTQVGEVIKRISEGYYLKQFA
ncbi:hypothetical protein [Oligoflexus tunisiensis]|uniref:hypothetical protein n=1 Tax=Oligoflexus tunisiensis TaxID=708132 RepID=UPI00114CD287|nr:hypothetical protein [Oligoflexus tunisiensis]